MKKIALILLCTLATAIAVLGLVQGLGDFIAIQVFNVVPYEESVITPWNVFILWTTLLGAAVVSIKIEKANRKKQ